MPAVVAHKANLTSKSTYVNHVSNGVDLPSVWEQLQGQLYLGDATFAEVLGDKMGNKLAADEEIPRLQRRKSATPLAQFAAMPERTTAIVQTFATGCYGMTEIAQAFEIHYATVSRIVKKMNLKSMNARPDKHLACGADLRSRGYRLDSVSTEGNHEGDRHGTLCWN